MNSIQTIAVIILVIVAAICDARTRRIPNVLVVAGVVTGLTFGFAANGAAGALTALAGIGVGVAALLPTYAFGALGAGDVKLFGAVGAFTGPTGVLGALLATFIAGGLLAVALVVRRRLLGDLLRNLKAIAIGQWVAVSTGSWSDLGGRIRSVGELPYAVAIAVGVTGWLAFSRLS